MQGAGATGSVDKTGSRGLGVCWVINNNTNRFSLCRLYKLGTERKIQTADWGEGKTRANGVE